MSRPIRETNTRQYNSTTAYLERTALILNHVRLRVSSKKDTSRKETSASPVTSLVEEEPCFTAETKACNERYLETVIGPSGLISAIAASLGSWFEGPERREKGCHAPKQQSSVNDLDISFYAFLLLQTSVHRF